MLAIDAILSILKDEKWHNLAEIAKKLALDEFRVKMIVSFLSEYGFIDFDKKSQKIKLTSLTREFIDEISHDEEEEAIRALSLR